MPASSYGAGHVEGLPLLHVVDVERTPDDLFRLVDNGNTLQCRTSEILLRKRLGLRIRRLAPRAVMAWSGKACEAALAAQGADGLPLVYYRPEPHDRRGVAGGIAICHSEAQQACLGGQVVRRPVPDVDRVDLDDGVFRWLLTDDSGPHADFSLAIWAGALIHVLMRREGKQHRLVLPGGSAFRHRQARRFADHLGLGELVEPWHATTYVEAARRSNAVLLTAAGPADAWAARLGHRLGVPIVSTASVEVREAVPLAAVVTPQSRQPRHVARSMLRVATGEELPEIAASDVASAEACLEQWASATGVV